MTVIATIRSYPVTRSDNKQDGFYEMEVELDMAEYILHQSKKLLVLDRIKYYAQHVANATGLPLHQSHYYVVMDKKIAKETGLPERFDT